MTEQYRKLDIISLVIVMGYVFIRMTSFLIWPEDTPKLGRFEVVFVFSVIAIPSFVRFVVLWRNYVQRNK